MDPNSKPIDVFIDYIVQQIRLHTDLLTNLTSDPSTSITDIMIKGGDVRTYKQVLRVLIDFKKLDTEEFIQSYILNKDNK